MAEGLFRDYAKKNSSDFAVKSAGVGAQNGLSPSENSVYNYDNVFEVDNFLINTFEIQSTLIERKEYLDKVELGVDFIFFTDWGIGYNLNKAINFDNSLLGYGIGCKIFLMNTVIKFEYALNMHGSSRWHLF